MFLYFVSHGAVFLPGVSDQCTWEEAGTPPEQHPAVQQRAAVGHLVEGMLLWGWISHQLLDCSSTDNTDTISCLPRKIIKTSDA